MYILYGILTLLVCHTQAFHHVPRNNSGQHWFKFQEKEYFIEENFKGNYLTAVHYCNYHKMQLIALESQAENDALYNEVANYLSGTAEFWSSGSRLANDDDWIWMSTGTPVKTFNWGDGEPNNENKKERCISVFYLHYQTGWWNDEDCDLELGVICETKDC